MTSRAMLRAIDQMHDQQTDHILDAFERQCRSARTVDELDALHDQFERDMRAALVRSCDTREAIAWGLN